MTALTIEVAHYVALVPLLACIWSDRARALEWFVAAGFAVSWLADSAAVMLDGSWVVTKVYPAAQLGCFLLAYGRWRWALGLVALAAVTLPLAPPDQIVTATGSVAVLYASRGERLAPAMISYCGVASLLYLGMTTELERATFWWLWYPYQVARVTSVALCLRELWASESRWT